MVAAAVRSAVLPALVSPDIFLPFLFLENVYKGIVRAAHTVPITCVSVSLQSVTGCLLAAPQAGPALGSVQPARSSEPAASGGPSRQPRSPDERPGRGDPERGGAEPGLAGLGLHIFTRRDLTQRSLLLLLLQPLRHGDDGHAGALPVSAVMLSLNSHMSQTYNEQMIQVTCFCLQASGRLVPLQPGERAPASWRQSQSGRHGGRATKPRHTRNGSCLSSISAFYHERNPELMG